MADFDPVSYMMGQKAGPRGGSSALSGLTDVDITNPTDGQTLVYNATSGKWENGEGGGGGVYCIDTSVVPSSVTIDDVEYTEINLDQDEGRQYPFYIIPESVVMGAKPFYLKVTESDGASEYLSISYPFSSNYFTADPAPDDPASTNPSVLTVSSPVFVCKTELSDVAYLIPDTAGFKTVKLPL